MTDHVYVSFSGGKDSVAAYIKAVLTYGKENVTLVFADTGDETPDTYEYVSWFDEHVHPVIRLGSLVTGRGSRGRELITVELDWFIDTRSAWYRTYFLTVFEEIRERHRSRPDVPSFPANGIRFCTSMLKVRAFDRWLKLRHPDPVDRDTNVIVAIGLRAAESAGRANTIEWGYDFDNGWRNWYPIHDWDITRVWQAHVDAGIKRNPTYDYRTRSNCIGCPFASNAEVGATIRKYGPAIVEEWQRLEEETGYTWKHRQRIGDTADNWQPPLFTDPDASCTSGYCDI